MFTDVVGSTRLAEELGDRAWRDRVEQHNELIRRLLRRFGGREVDTAGDGFFAAFDAPARAVACALTIVDQMPGLGLGVRSGVHTGEVEAAGGKLRGIAVHIGSRIGAEANAGEVLVSATVRDLVAGTAIEFKDRGVHELKGVTGEWRIYAATRSPRFAEEFGVGGDSAGREAAAVRRSLALRARRRRLVLAGAGLTLVIAVAAASYLVTRPPPSLPAVDANAAGLIDAASGRIIAQVPVGSQPDGVAFGEGAVWVANRADNTVSRIDPIQRLVVQTIDVGAGPGALAVGFGSVWVANGDERTVSRINAATNRVVQTIVVGSGPSGVATGAGAVWVTNSIDGTLARIDPSSGSVTASYDVGGSPTGIAADNTSVWIAASDRGVVTRFDPTTGQVVSLVGVGNSPRALAITNGAVWVANALDGTVSRIDSASAHVTATVEVGQGPSGIAVDSNGGIWVASAFDGAAYHIDPRTNQPARYAIGSAPQALVTTGDEVWLSARASATSHRGGTLHIVAAGGGDTIDPAIAGDGLAWSILTITNDGLVAYQRTGGIAGATIVADLAMAVPAPSDGGLTYTFQLRPGLVYSDGQPVVASDFRHALERVYNIPGATGGGPATPFSYGIAGATDCEESPRADCDLSAGIVTNDAAGTVTFHLTAADPDFLQKLAMTYAVAVPPSVGSTDVGHTPVPATGAYKVDTVNDTEIRLVRNPLFHEWNRLARPDGYADEIVVTIGPDRNTQLDMLVAQSADAMALQLPPPEANRVEQLRLQYPAQVHPSLIGTLFLHMNTSVAPFDDARVRQAVNFAVNRADVVAALGGDLQGRATCQVLASNLPGYKPYCPYTINPNEVGMWTGPDLQAARNLIAAAAPTRTDVTVLADGRFVPVAQSIVQALDQIGFEAAVREPRAGGIIGEVTDPKLGPLVQAVVIPWLPDIHATVDEVYPIFQCGEPINFTNLCDDSIAHAVDDALVAQAGDPAAAREAWAKVDRTIVDLAPAAALANLVYPDFVSSAVGNYQYHPQWGPLYDQLWVK
jgi:YVTN family beta-propeller protein